VSETATSLRHRIAAAIEGRRRLRDRPITETVQTLAAAAQRWRDDPELRSALPDAIGLTPPVVAIAVAHAAEAFDATLMTALARTELAGLEPPDDPPLVAHVLASNVPALALPAIAHACLAGAAVVVKSGRRDRVSAPAFVRALADVDPELAATVVDAYWPGGDPDLEAVLLERATVAVATGSDATVEALALRAPVRVIAHGARIGVVAVDLEHADAATLADLVARDVALHDQRGCLSPHTVWVVGDARGLAVELTGALDAAEAELPMAEAPLEERAGVRIALDDAEWQGATVLRAAAGAVVYDDRPEAQPAVGGRVVRVQPLRTLADLASVLPAGRIECVGLAGGPAPAGLLERGVSRVCPPGRMQRPALAWPRGQQAPLRSLLEAGTPPLMEVET
jgi:acyl-CoA reductase-like NAD-dependent aldehyde dehydrogenase